MPTTEAWVIHPDPAGAATPGELHLEQIEVPEPGPDEVLVEPLLGGFEANMDHAIRRSPIDVCRQRGDDTVVLGNSAVVRVLRPGSDVRDLREGDRALLLPFGAVDRHGYVELVWGYDYPGSTGVMARRVTVPARILLPLPRDTRHSTKEWVHYQRYFTAWDNWKVASRCWRAQVEGTEGAAPLVFGWGGGVVLAELELAREEGFTTAMTSADPDRLAQIADHKIEPVDRRAFADLSLDPKSADESERERYRAAERTFLATIDELSGGEGVAVLLDNIGGPLYKPTMKALARQGVIATVGWKHGMKLWNLRATECIKRHLHVHTHVWRYQDSPIIRDHQEASDWFAPVADEPIWEFERIPELAAAYARGDVHSYFPTYRINPE